MDDHEYTGLGDIDDDVLLLEWDIAVSREDLVRFAAKADQHPADVLVAPYTLCSSDRPWMVKWRDWYDSQGAIWAHFKFDADGLVLDPVRTGDPFCHWFGFGMTYLPRDLIRGYLEARERFPALRRFTDSSFDAWHYSNIKRNVPIAWDIRPIHLHYQIPTLEPKVPEPA